MKRQRLPWPTVVSAPACAQTVPTLGPRASSLPAQGDLPPSPEGSVHAHRFPGPAPPPFVLLAGQRLLYSLPHFLGSQGHHHLGDRGSLRLSTEGHAEEFHHVTVFGAFQIV